MHAERVAIVEAPAAMTTIGEVVALFHFHLSTLLPWEKSGWRLQSTRPGPRGHRRYNRESILGLARRTGVGETEAKV